MPILDLILTNDPDSCLNTEVDINIKYSDHNLVTVRTSLRLDRNYDKSESNLEYVTKIPFYNWRHGSEYDWENYENFLHQYNWLEETNDMVSIRPLIVL